MSRPSLGFACLLILLCLGLSPAGAGQVSYRLHQDKNLAYSLEVPALWSAQPGSKGRSLVFSGPQGSPEYRTTLSLQVVDADAFPNLGAVAQELVSQWSRLRAYRLLSQEKGSLAGQKALRLLVAFSSDQGEAFRREQFICRKGPYYYLLAYTAPEKLFAVGTAYRDRALASLSFLSPQQKQLRQDSLNVAAYGPALLKQLGGPLYSPSFANGTPQGEQVAKLHGKLVAELAMSAVDQAAAQKPVLKAMDRLGELQTRQMVLLEEQAASSARAKQWWDRLKPLYKLQLNYSVVQSAQRGMVEGNLAGQGKPEEIGQSLAAVQMLAGLQLAVSDQQALILKQNQEVWVASVNLWDQVSGDTALPAAFRLRLAQINQRQREMALELGKAILESNAAQARNVLTIRAMEVFSREVTRAYGAAVAEAIPGLRAQAAELAQARPGDPAVQAVTVILDNLERTAGQIKTALAPPPPGLAQRLARALSPTPAWAGAWQFTKDFGNNLLWSVALAAKTTANTGRFIASGMDTSTKRVADYLQFATYSPFRVTSDPKELVGSVDAIIKKNPKMAKHRAVITERLKAMAKGHAASDLNGYMQIKKQTTDAAVAEYAKGEYGVRALKTGVQYLDEVQTMKVEPAARWVSDKVTKGILGKSVGGFISPAAQGTAGLLAGTAYRVVSDIPKNLMVLMNPKTSKAEKGQATYELASSVGASVLCYTGTAAALVGKVAPGLAAGVKGAFNVGASVVSRMIPAGVKAATQATTKMVAPVAQQAGKQVAREVAALLPAEAQAVKYAAMGVQNGVHKIAAMASQPVGSTLMSETLATIKNVGKNLAMSGTPGQVLKKFAEEFTFKGLLKNAANDSFSDNVLLPTLQSIEAAANAKPPSSGVSRSFNNSNLLKADQQKVERSFNNENLLKADKQKVERSFNNENLLKADKQKVERSFNNKNLVKKDQGFKSSAAAGGEKSEAEKPAEKKTEAKPAKKTKPRKETPEERKARRAALMAKAKRLAARKENPVYSDTKMSSTAVIPSTCTIDTVAWHPKYPESKWRASYYLRGGQVSATTDHTQAYDKWCNENWCCSPQRTTGTFTGSLMNNVITGDWKLTSPPTRCWSMWRKSTKGGDGKYTYTNVRCEYTQYSTHNMRNTLTLNTGGTLEETYTGSGSATTVWGPTCHETVAGTTKTNNWTSSWDDPKSAADLRKPMVGVWEIRKRPKSEEK